MQLTFETQSEATPGPVVRQNIERFWPAYRRWFLAGGGAQSARAEQARDALRAHMPELLPVFERLVELGPDDPLFARFLTLYRPPAFIGACSMAAIEGEAGRRLVRNYDFDPTLTEGVILESAWRGRKVLGMADCLWGLVDGLNEDGLAVALTFGGRREAEDGFGIPLILRYVLETARDVPDAIEALRCVPSHMAYNVGLVDRAGRHAMVHLEPGGGATVVDEPVATNHQGRIHWPAQAEFTATVERKEHLLRLVDAASAGEVAHAFLRAPLYRAQYGAGFGTLYTAELDPAGGHAIYRWPDHDLPCVLGEDLRPRSVTIEFVEGQGARSRVTERRPDDQRAPDAFAATLEIILAGLGTSGRPADPDVVHALRQSPAAWARLGELFQPRA